MNNTIEELYAFVDEHPELDEEAMIEALKEKFPHKLVNEFVDEIHILLTGGPNDGRTTE